MIRKPGAFPGATALEQARSAGKFTPVHDDWWDAARVDDGDKDGTKALIEVLLLGRHMNHEHLVAGLATALRAGAFTADAVALEARKAPAHGRKGLWESTRMTPTPWGPVVGRGAVKSLLRAAAR
ncbi:hypothetical protein AB0D57_30880 [Streptomyces sp. NPDC048275]|uniref:hypothetical protein n=1 Tax=Streptomyces sp. NPDC048275 TaxID=3155629 RepID=UPI0033E744D2